MFDALRLFQTEAGLIFLSIGCLCMDAFLPVEEKRGRTLASIAMIGVALLFGHLFFQWGNFGTAMAGSYVQDGVALLFKGIFLLAGLFTLFMVREYQPKLKRGHGEIVLLVLFSLVGMTFLASAGDFLLFFIALETLTVSLYIMTAYTRHKSASIEAGVKYIVLGALSTAVFLYGLSFVYGAAGSTHYITIQTRIAAMPHVPTSFLFGTALVVASLCFKIAAVPFHLWVPDVYEGAPTPVTAYLSIGSKAAGFAALVRLLLTALAPAQAQLAALFAVLAALTIVYGNLGAIPQTNLKRLLGYSSIGHAGYMLIGLAAFTSGGGESVAYYLLSYVFSTGGAFLVLVALSAHVKTSEIKEFAGLSQRSPLLAAGMFLALLSLAGVPPLAGFFAKFYLLWAGVKAGLVWLVLIGVLNVITSLFYYLKIVKVMYVDKPLDLKPITLTADQVFFQALSIGGILVLGIAQGPFVRLIAAAFQK